MARRRRDTKEAETWPSSDWTQHEDWEHYQAHRDRRDLYKSLEGMMYVATTEIEGYDLSLPYLITNRISLPSMAMLVPASTFSPV